MAALVQTFPSQQSSSTVTMMQSRTPSGSGSSGTPARYGNSGSGYRAPPVAPYAFTSTPALNPKANSPQKVVQRPDDSKQSYTSLETLSNDTIRPPTSQSSSTQRSVPRPLSSVGLQASVPAGLTSPTSNTPSRYKKRPESVVLQPNQMPQVYGAPNRSSSTPSIPQVSGVMQPPFIGDHAGQLRSSSVDDINVYRSPAPYVSASDNRRKSVHGAISGSQWTAGEFQNFIRQEISGMSQRPAVGDINGNNGFKPPQRPGSRRTGSTDSSGSGASSRASSSHRNSIVSNTSNAPSNSPTHDINLAHVPPRGSSTDAVKRTTAPSPLSKPVTLGTESGSSYQKFPPPSSSGSTMNGDAKASPASTQLNALNDSQKKGVKNRLRRAFSFGSAAELRKASAANLRTPHGVQQRQTPEDLEAARIARRQEEAGLGESIYTQGQGNIFTGSTDNISVSSTASSASIMIRKMGKGLKRSSRNLAGLFRPKSVIGVAPASGPINSADATTGSVSMVTVEAEREKVNVNAHVSDKGGVTGFPKLERNSIDASRAEVLGSLLGDSGDRRQSIVDADKERAEVLASMKKGILKRAGSSSPIVRATDHNSPMFQLPEIPGIENQRPGSNRSQSMKNSGEDYFQTTARFISDNNSAPASPNSNAKYSVTFSPRITFFDTFPASEYDRRGEIATCNRLTPLLAQQIKEELNSFKMEMDVHEESKVYTHFF